MCRAGQRFQCMARPAYDNDSSQDPSSQRVLLPEWKQLLAGAACSVILASVSSGALACMNCRARCLDMVDSELLLVFPCLRELQSITSMSYTLPSCHNLNIVRGHVTTMEEPHHKALTSSFAGRLCTLWSTRRGTQPPYCRGERDHRNL